MTVPVLIAFHVYASIHLVVHSCPMSGGTTVSIPLMQASYQNHVCPRDWYCNMTSLRAYYTSWLDNVLLHNQSLAYT